MEDLNGIQAREYNRAQTLALYFSEQKDVYTLYAPFSAEVNLFFKNNNQLIALVPVKDVTGEGIITGEKGNLKVMVATLANTICTRVAAYAKKIGDTKLETTIYNRTSAIIRLKDAAVLGFVTRLVSNVTPLLNNADFQAYSVTQNMLDTLTKTTVDFNNSIGKAAIAQSNNSYTSRAINDILKNIRSNVVQFNLLLNFFGEDYPAFVDGYRKASTVTNTGIRHNGIEGVVKNLSTGDPVKGVIITGEGKNKMVSTNAKGEYKLNRLKTGSMLITIAAPGYDSQTITVTIIRGKILELNVNLQAQVITMATA